MRLWVLRETKASWRRRRGYRLAVKLDVTAKERSLMARHGLEAVDLWVGMTALATEAQAESSLDLAREVEGASSAELNRALTLNVRGIYLGLIEAYREARVSVKDALDGKVLDAMLVAECAMAEAGVRAGVAALEKQLEALKRYDLGEEELSATEEDAAPNPRDWKDLTGEA